MPNGVEYYEIDEEDFDEFEAFKAKKAKSSGMTRQTATQPTQVDWVFAGRPVSKNAGWAVVIGIFVAGIAVGVAIMKYGKKAMNKLGSRLG